MARKIFPNKDSISEAAALIRAGGLVAFPTETVYGLGANALDREAVARIFEAKGRPSSSPLIVHVGSAEIARGLVEGWPEAAEALSARYWPGPLTLVLPKRPLVPDNVTAGLSTVGIRMPAHPVALELIRTAGLPIAAPSANRFTELSPTTADHVIESLGDSVEVVIDAGPSAVGIESTVLSLASATPVLLRPGMVTRQELEAVLGPIEETGRIENGAHPSPGMHRRHYSPRTPLVLTADTLPEGRGAYLWIHHRLVAAKCVGMPREPGQYAAVLYGTLHGLDAEGWDWIAVETPPREPAWAGILDRLERAAMQ